jgi:hypothetical protein
LPSFLAKFSALNAWQGRMESRPSFIKTIEK